MAVKPLEDRVLVKPIEAETKTASGIYLPEASKEKPVKGEVIATSRSTNALRRLDFPAFGSPRMATRKPVRIFCPIRSEDAA